MTEYAVHDPSTGELVQSYPTATDADVRAVVTSHVADLADLLR